MADSDKMREIFAKAAETLKDQDTTAVQKLAARDKALDLADELGADTMRKKALKDRMMGFIKEGRLKATGPIGGFAMDDMVKAGKKAKKAGRKIPGLGLVLAGVTALTDSPSAAASELVQGAEEALIPGGIGRLGPEEGSPGAVLEDPNAPNEAKKQAVEALRKQYAGNKEMGEAQQEGFNYDANRAQMAADTEDNQLLKDIQQAARKRALMSKVR